MWIHKKKKPEQGKQLKQKKIIISIWYERQQNIITTMFFFCVQVYDSKWKMLQKKWLWRIHQAIKKHADSCSEYIRHIKLQILKRNTKTMACTAFHCVQFPVFFPPKRMPFRLCFVGSFGFNSFFLACQLILNDKELNKVKSVHKILWTTNTLINTPKKRNDFFGRKLSPIRNQLHKFF